MGCLMGQDWDICFYISIFAEFTSGFLKMPQIIKGRHTQAHMGLFAANKSGPWSLWAAQLPGLCAEMQLADSLN